MEPQMTQMDTDKGQPTNHPTPTVGRDSVEPLLLSTKTNHGSPESRPTDSQPLPQSFHDLALQLAFAIYQDIHIKGSGLVFFALLGYGVLSPQNKEQCQQLAALAATYLFGATINRKSL
jgi:hypothetical protein